MRKLLAVFLAAVLLAGCTAQLSVAKEPEKKPEKKQYTATFLTLFDTVTTIVGRAESEEVFRAIAQTVHDDLLRYHQLFDIYNDYEGVNNLKTVNDMAGIAPVQVDGAVIALLRDCVEYHARSGGRVNIAMGSVLALWHDARQSGVNDPANAKLPDMDALKEASGHCDIANIVIDEQNSTVYLNDPEMRLDVGAIAKGWATQRAAENAPEGLLISVGGNVCATGAKTEAGDPWVIGVRDPMGSDEDFVHTLYVSSGCVVTSGDYQRTYMVDGTLYHHIIDPETLLPGNYWKSVTVVCEDSALADMLSTALFLTDKEEGLALLQECGAEAMWVDTEGKNEYSPGFQKIIRT